MGTGDQFAAVRVAVPMTEFRAAAVTADEYAHRLLADTPSVLLGMSVAMDQLRDEVQRALASDRPVVVSGESGSGKSLVARALHQHGPRAKERCTVVACEAFPRAQLDVELFGSSESGARGTPGDRRGVLERADGGTVILENIDTLSPRSWASLERILTTGRLKRAGTAGPGIVLNARLVATSTMRSHLGALAVSVPSLRERQADIPLLSQFFATAADRSGCGVSFSADAMNALSAYSWPGNVSQLKTVIERLVAHADGGQIRATDLPVGIRPRGYSDRVRREQRARVGGELFAQLRSTGTSFWSSVYPLFMRREITRRDLRDVVRRALEVAQGDGAELMHVLNLPAADRRRFEQFLRKFGCALPPYASSRQD